jgi:signal peptidase I
VSASHERSLLRYIWRGISYGILGVLVLLAVLILVVPAVTGAERFTIAGGSMEPSIPLGSLVIVRPVAAEEIRVGDVITFQLVSGEPAVATHRVVAVGVAGDGSRTFTTRGDANAAPDADPVIPEQVRGVVQYAIPGIGWINAVLTGELRAWLIPAAAIALFAYAGWMFVRAGLDHRRRRAAARAPDLLDPIHAATAPHETQGKDHT